MPPSAPLSAQSTQSSEPSTGSASSAGSFGRWPRTLVLQSVSLALLTAESDVLDALAAAREYRRFLQGQVEDDTTEHGRPLIVARAAR